MRRDFDAEQPHTPRGCIVQAWSVAELLRAHVALMRSGFDLSLGQVPRSLRSCTLPALHWIILAPPNPPTRPASLAGLS